MATEIPLASENHHLARSRKFKTAAQRVIEIKQEIAGLEEELDILKTQKIEPELVMADVRRIRYRDEGTGDWQFGIVDRKPGRRIIRERLIAACEKRGYDLAVIEEGSIETEGAHYVEVRSPQDGDEGIAGQVRNRMKRSLK